MLRPSRLRLLAQRDLAAHRDGRRLDNDPRPEGVDSPSSTRPPHPNAARRTRRPRPGQRTDPAPPQPGVQPETARGTVAAWNAQPVAGHRPPNSESAVGQRWPQPDTDAGRTTALRTVAGDSPLVTISATHARTAPLLIFSSEVAPNRGSTWRDKVVANRSARRPAPRPARSSGVPLLYSRRSGPGRVGGRGD